MGRDPVKSTADFWRVRGWGVALLVVSFSTLAGAQKRQEGGSLLLGGTDTPRKPPILLDPVLPHGEFRKLPQPTAETRLCDSRRPVCIGTGSEAAVAKGALEVLVRAYEEHTYGSSLPSPVDAHTGELVWELGEPSLRVERRLIEGRGFDRGRAGCWGGAPTLETARRCVSEAAIFRYAPATAHWLVEGQSTAWAEELLDAPDSEKVIDDSFRHVSSGVLTSSQSYQKWSSKRAEPLSSRRSARFFRYLSARSPAFLGHAGYLALTLAATHTPAGAVRYEAEPDLLDVLSSTVGYDPSALARLFDDFAQFSFFDGLSRGQNPKVDWTLPGESLPRSVAYSDAIEPTGSLYLLVELTSQQKEKTMAFKVACESPVSYVWSAVRIFEGQKRGPAVLAGYQERGTSSELRVEPLPGTKSLLLVGTNMGGVDMTHPFDPDHEPHEAHGCRAYVSTL